MSAPRTSLRARAASWESPPGKAELFDALWDAISSPSDSIQDDLIFLVDELKGPVTDPTSAERDVLLKVVDRPAFRHQLIVTRMLVAAGAPIHQHVRDCANSKFEGLWGLIVHPAFEETFYDGPISLLASRHDA